MLHSASSSVHLVLLVCGLISGAMPIPAQEPGKAAAPPLDSASRRQVIDSVLKLLRETYVYPEVAQKMEAAIRERLRKGEYEDIGEGNLFAQRLTKNLQDVSHDKHLEVEYSSTALPEHNKAPSAAEKAKTREAYRKRGEAVNWGFEKVERLSGNIGYLDFRFFADPELAGDTLASAMNFLGNTDALILDLRNNGGGQPTMVAVVCSYFFGPKPVHLSDLSWRPDNSTQQYWTMPYVPGKRYLDKDVYVLTSKETLSAAEGFAYDLKTHKRATLIGETTAGYAHPGSNVRINEHYSVIVPQGRVINSVTKTDWEGTGVRPDIEVPAPLALKTAHVAALKKALQKEMAEKRSKHVRAALVAAQKELDDLKNK